MNRLLPAALVAALCLGTTAAAAGAADFGYGSSGSFGAAGTGDGELTMPRQMAVQNSTGRVFVADSGDGRVEVFTPGGGTATYLTQFGASGPTAPTGVAVDQAGGDVYVAGSDGIVRYVGSGAPTPAFAVDPTFSGSDASAIQGATELAVDPTTGDLLVADPANARIARFAPNGTFESAFTGMDIPGGGPLADPISVAVDAAGLVYVVDATADPTEAGGTSRALRFAADGTYQHTYDVPTPGSVALDPHTGYTLFSADVAAFGGTDPRVYAFDGDTAATDFAVPGDPGNPPVTLRSLAVDGGASAQLYVLTDMAFGCCGPVGVQVLVSGPRPGAVLSAPSQVTGTTAHLTGTVTPPGEQTAWHFETSTDGATWTPVGTDQDAGSGTSAVPVAADVTDLSPNTAYQVRLVATTSRHVDRVTDPESFTTLEVAPAVGAAAPGRVTATTAVARGTVNSNNAPTTYYVEYGPDARYGSAAPATRDADAGSGGADVVVSQELDGLQPGATYHYRVVAHNDAGTTAGDDHTVTTRPNDQSGAPAGMHYELVSPADVGGTLSGPIAQSSSGDRIALGTGPGQGFGGTPSYSRVGNQFVSSRTPSGWVTAPLNASVAPNGATAVGVDFSADLGVGLAQVRSLAQYHAGQEAFALTGLDGVTRGTLPAVTNLEGTWQDETNLQLRYRGASADLSHLLIEVPYNARLLDTDSPAADHSEFRLYDLTGAGTSSAVIRRVAVDDGGAEIGAECGAEFGAQGDGGAGGPAITEAHAISADGARIFFSARPGADTPGASCDAASGFPVHVFARIGAAHTIDLSATECHRAGCTAPAQNAVYEDSSKDGGRVLVLASDPLVDGDTDATQDLYLYDFTKPAGHRLTQVSAGDATDATPGANADVQRLIQLSDDGSRIYFTATGVLTTQPNAFGDTATSGAENMYLYEPDTDRTTFVATLSSSDPTPDTVARSSALSDPSGRFLAFDTYARISPADTDDADDVYRFDAATDGLVKVSPGNAEVDANITHYAPTAVAVPQASPISADGRVVFRTAEALQPDDTNDAPDIYMGDGAGTQMVSDGQDPAGADLAYSISSDGRQVAFATSRRLAPEDHDDVISTYVARTGPDVTHAPAVATRCSGDACQSAPSPPPALTAPASSSAGGQGQATTPARTPTFRLRALDAAQRARLLKSGSATVTVIASDAGTLDVVASTTINRRSRALARARRTLRRGETAHLTIRLSRATRREVGALKRWTLKLTASYSKAATTHSVTAALGKAAPKKAKKTSATRRPRTER